MASGRISGACGSRNGGRRPDEGSQAKHSQERKGFAFALKEPEPSVLRSHKSKKKLNTK